MDHDDYTLNNAASGHTSEAGSTGVIRKRKDASPVKDHLKCDDQVTSLRSPFKRRADTFVNEDVCHKSDDSFESSAGADKGSTGSSQSSDPATGQLGGDFLSSPSSEENSQASACTTIAGAYTGQGSASNTIDNLGQSSASTTIVNVYPGQGSASKTIDNMGQSSSGAGKKHYCTKCACNFSGKYEDHMKIHQFLQELD